MNVLSLSYSYSATTPLKMSLSTEARLPLAKKDECHFAPWILKTTISHIMGSKCENLDTCTREEALQDNTHLCNVCLYGKELSLSSLPDMVFADNKLVCCHSNGGSIEFNALDALKEVRKDASQIEVAHAKIWQDARSDCKYAKRIVKDYDWTYSTSYSGTIKGPLKISPTNERIDLEKLKIQEEILFYKEIFLYEDELDDNGCSRSIVKVRVMSSGFFVVFRHYLRVDHVMIRVSDTRLYYKKDTDGILKEWSLREAPISNLQVDVATYKNPDVIWQHLPLIKETVDKICPV